jgi:hypothetical protein
MDGFILVFFSTEFNGNGHIMIPYYLSYASMLKLKQLSICRMTKHFQTS